MAAQRNQHAGFFGHPIGKLMLAVLLLPGILACISTPNITPTGLPAMTPIGNAPTPVSSPTRPQSDYHATFEMTFEGETTWRYHLETRADGTKTAYQLHIEGVPAAQNPGDVRIVVDSQRARMRGPATDDACVEFPSDTDLGHSLLSPQDLIPLSDLEGGLRPARTEPIAEAEAIRYKLEATSLAGWRDVAVEVWMAEASHHLLAYDFRAQGNDPFFGAGEGAITAHYVITSLAPQTIEPIRGCEIDLPLPEDATRLVKMPGLVAFDQHATVQEIARFYQTALPQAGWEPLDEPQPGTDSLLLSYRKDGETLAINVEPTPAGVHVEIWRDAP